jgi:cell division protein FtsB
MERLWKVLRPLRNFYVATLVLFSVWMIFFDGSNWRMMTTTWLNLQSTKEKKRFYQEKIAEVKRERDAVMGSTQALEKFAREKYLMKKPTEELFIVKEETVKPE